MLKDITLGQFFPGNTIIHRLDPRTKILALVLYIAALFAAKAYFGYLAVLAALSLFVLLSHIRLKTILRGLKPVIIIVALTAILNLFYTDGDPIISFWVVTITKQGIISAVMMALRIMMLITCSLLLTYTTAPIAITDGLESLLSPLKKLKLPVHELSMMMSIALRFIPTLIEETDKIMSAQKARGADFETGSIFRRARALLPLLVPLFVSAFRRADELATAMECRCYHGGEGRTRMKVLKMKDCDWVSLLLLCGLLAGVIVLNRWGI